MVRIAEALDPVPLVRSVRLAVAASVIVGIVGVSVLPALHVHAEGLEGRTQPIVHRHSLEGVASGSSGTSVAAHGDHARALFLDASYDSVSRFVPHVPAVVDAAITILPSVVPLPRVQIDSAPPAHGPPGRIGLTRAPPAAL
jgi:hypothetical protein